MSSSTDETKKLSLIGSIALGTGVMIGAGIFALVGQVAELAGSAIPWAFVAGAVVVAFSAYSYVRYSSTDPSSGGIAMILTAAYGPGVIAGSFSLFMYVSMILAESLLARTFGTYLLRPFGMQNSPVWVPVLAVTAIVAATIVNLVGNRWVEGSATVTAALKIAGIGVLAVAGIIATGMSALSDALVGRPGGAPPDSGLWGFLAGTTLCILAYKGFTTITNQGADIRNPERNIARSIVIAIAVCTVIYLLLTVAVVGSLPVPQILAARGYALAEAAEPLFGSWGGVVDGGSGRCSNVVGSGGEPVLRLQVVRHAARDETSPGCAGVAQPAVSAHHRSVGTGDGEPVRPEPDRGARSDALSVDGHRHPLGNDPPTAPPGRVHRVDSGGGHRT
ncbi:MULTISPECIES: APC family permease [Rhodococcus]|uniref:APC family permease n=1 Tax=Rhodococcus TaxID=1827 RepID=UPI001E287E26|nr:MULTISPECIES: APC family permease [Rhodococcus]BDB60742.1 hypothetical protein RDE2_25360 [Rhodococcus sp. RDE2]